jgi:hypothetical protein
VALPTGYHYQNNPSDKKVPMDTQHQSLINQAKTTYHPNHKIEWLLWQLAIALEEALMEINDLKNKEK